MTFRPYPKYASRDAKLGPLTTCDTCGLLWNQSKMQFQFDYVGGPLPEDQNWLRCPRCITPLTLQRKLLIIPPDPPPLVNTRPEPYTVEESNWLTTMDGEQYQTTGGSDYITQIPNPDDNADTTVLTASLSYAGTLSVAYLDLYYGNPATNGVSILEVVTGSATRTNIFSQLEADTNDVLRNPDIITITSASEITVNVNYVAIFSAASGGTLLTSGTVSTSFPTLVEGAAVQFNQLGLQIAQS